jgi:hypothetical protein
MKFDHRGAFLRIYVFPIREKPDQLVTSRHDHSMKDSASHAISFVQQESWNVLQMCLDHLMMSAQSSKVQRILVKSILSPRIRTTI